MLLFSPGSQAFDWLFQPSFDASERYTDNLRMQINPTRDNFVTTLSPSLLVGYLEQNQELKTSFRWNELLYHDDADMGNFAEKIANFSHQYSGERFKTELAAQYAEQSSINTQLDPEGSGNLQFQIPRFTISVSPALTYNFTERNALRLSYNYLDVSFDRTPETQQNIFSYSDYQNQQVTATAIHSYSDRLSINLTGAYTNYTSPTDFSNSGNYLYCNDLNPPKYLLPGLPILICSDGKPPIPSLASTAGSYEQSSTNLTYQAGFQYIFDEQTQLSASAGWVDTKTTTDFSSSTTYDPTNSAVLLPKSRASSSQSSSGSGYVFSANLTRNSDWGGLILNADQQVTPSSSGSQQQSTSFSANLKYDLSERWSTGFDARYLLTESSLNNSDNITNNNRTFISLSPNIRWRWTPEINLNLSYSYRHQQYESRDDPSISNNLQLQFSYQPQINRLVK